MHFGSEKAPERRYQWKELVEKETKMNMLAREKPSA